MRSEQSLPSISATTDIQMKRWSIARRHSYAAPVFAEQKMSQPPSLLPDILFARPSSNNFRRRKSTVDLKEIDELQGGFEEFGDEPLVDEDESMAKRHGWRSSSEEENNCDPHRPIIVQEHILVRRKRGKSLPRSGRSSSIDVTISAIGGHLTALKQFGQRVRPDDKTTTTGGLKKRVGSLERLEKLCFGR
uniref:Uncharacterized protein n=1 Tax=Plectus sambesii TaxID=2011161 RepID=A0A914UYS4_9BILA